MAKNTVRTNKGRSIRRVSVRNLRRSWYDIRYSPTRYQVRTTSQSPGGRSSQPPGNTSKGIIADAHTTETNDDS